MKIISESKYQEAVELLREMVIQADEDCPSEYRTKHFRSAMKDGINFLVKYDNAKNKFGEGAIEFAEWSYDIRHKYINIEDYGIRHPEFMEDGNFISTKKLYEYWVENICSVSEK